MYPFILLIIFIIFSNSPQLNNNEDKQLSISETTISKFNEIVYLLLTQRKINVECLDFLFSFLEFLYSNSNNSQKPCTIYYKCVQLVQTCLYYTSNQVHYVIE